MKASRYTYLFMLLIGLCPGARLFAQGICSSSALAPVFKQTFGTGASPASKTTVPSGFSTNYAFNGSSALADGQYMVTPLVQNSQKADWALGGDHTGDANGNMFLVNAGTGASVFFQQQVNNLCPGSTYSFSAWMVNVNTLSLTMPICTSSYVYPNVTFNIKNTNGVILQSYNTGNLPFTADRTVAPNWQQYGFQFSLPAGTTSLILEMVDSYGGAPQCGNDLAIDDILFSACTPNAQISFSTASSICAGTSTTMNALLTNSSFVSPAYQWQKSSNNGVSWSNIGTAGATATSFVLNNVSSSDGAMYRVLVGPDVSSLSSNTCVTASNNISLTVNALPSANIAANIPICVGGNISLQANASGGLSPYTYDWAGPSFISALANPVIANVNITSQSGTYALTVTDANNCSVTSSAQLSVNANASTAVAGNAQTSCEDHVTLNGNIPAVGVGLWAQTAGPSTALIADPLQYNTQVYNLLPGLYEFTWTISNGLCATSSDQVTVNVLAPTLPGTLSPDASVCAGINSGVLFLNGQNGNIVQWQLSTDGGMTWSNIQATDPSYQYQNLSQTTQFRVMVQNGQCVPVFSNTVTITVTPPTQPGTLSGDATVCASTNQGLLSLSASTGDVVQWESSADGGQTWSIVANTATTYTYSNLAITTAFRVLVQNGNCQPAYSNPVTVAVTQPSIAGTLSADATVCSGSNNGTLNLSGSTGSIINWETSTDSGQNWTPINQTTNTYSYNNLTASISYRVNVQNGTCTAAQSNSVTITVQQPTTAGTLSADATVCSGSNNGTLHLTGSTGSVLNWETSTDGGQTWAQINQTTNTLSYNNLTVTTLYRVNLQNGTCGAAQSNSVTITVQQPTIAGILSADATVCSGSNNGTLNLTGSTGSVLNWETSTDGGQNWAQINQTVNTYSYNNLTASTSYRVNVQNGTCGAAQSNSVTITVQQPTTAGTLSADATVCSGSNNGTLNLTGSTGSVLNWETSTDGGQTWAQINQTTNTFSYNNLTVTTSYRVNLQNGVCTAAHSNPVTITVQQPTTAGTLSADATVCSGSNNGTLHLTGSTGSIINWQTSTDGGQTWAQINQTTNTYSYNNITVTTSYRVNLQNGVCTAAQSNPVTITVQQPTTAGTLSADATVCSGSNNGALHLTGSTGSIINWQTSTDGGQNWTPINQTTNTLSYNNLTVTTSYRVNLQNGVCTAAQSNPVTITVQQPTVAGTLSSDATVCSGSNNGTLHLAGSAGSVLNWETSTDGGQNWTPINQTTNTYSYNNLTVTTSYRVNLQNGVCAAAQSNSVTITVQQPTTPGTLSADATVCSGSNNGTLNLSGFMGSIINWETSTDGGQNWTPINQTTNTLSYNNLTVTTSYRVNLQNGVCTAAQSNPVTITVQQPTTAGTLSADATVCSGSNNGTLHLTGSTGSIINWETSTDGGQTWAQINQTTNTLSYNNLTVTTSYRVNLQNGVCTAAQSNSVTITVQQPTTAGTLSADATVCSGSNNGTLHLTGSTGSVLNWETSTDGGQTWAQINQTTNTLSYNNLTVTTSYRVNLQNGVCTAAQSNPVTITVQQPTVAGTLSSDATVCSGSNNGTLNLAGSAGSVLNWETSTDGGQNWAQINQTANTYSYNNLTATTSYRVNLQNGVCTAAQSNSVTITVQQPTTAGMLSADATVCSGLNNGTLHLTGSIGSVLNWETSTDGGQNWTPINQTTNTFSYNNLTVTTSYRVNLQNGVCTAAQSNPVTITVQQPTTAGTLSADATVCSGSNNGTLHLTGSIGSVLNWETSTDGGQSWTPINQTTNTYSYNNLTVTTLYRVNLQNGVCAAAQSNLVTITVQQPTIAGILSADATVCSGSNNGTLNLSGFTGSIINWETSTDGGQSWVQINQTANTYSYNNLTATTSYRVNVQNGSCASAHSNFIKISVTNPVAHADAGADLSLCSVSVAALNGNALNGATGSWRMVSGPSAVSFANNAAPQTNVSGLTAGVYRFAWSVSNGVCAASEDTITVVNNSAIVNTIDTNGQIVCKGQSVSIGSAGNGAYQYSWQKSYDGITWETIGTASTPVYAFIADSTIYLRRLASLGGCSSASGTLKIGVKQAIHNNLISGNQQLCTGALATGITGNLPSGDGNYSYQWERSTDNGVNWTAILNATGQNIRLTDSIKTSISLRRIASTAACNGPLSSVSNIISLIVLPNPVLSVQYQGGLYCSRGVSVDFSPVSQNADSILWDFGDGTVLRSASQKVSHVYSANGNFLPVLTGVSSAGCAMKATASDTIRIDELKAGFGISAVYNCGQTKYRFTDSSISYSPILQRIWTLGTQQLSGELAAEQSFTKGGDYQAGLQLRNQSGCTNALQANFAVSIYNYPEVNIDAIGQACLNNLLELKSVINSIDSVTNRLWNLGNGNNASDSIVKVQYYSQGQYTVKLMAATVNNCLDSAVKQINVHSLPQINAVPEQTSCKGDTIELKATGALYYIWKDDQDSILCSNCLSARISPKKNATYKVIGYSKYGCSNIGSTAVRLLQPFKMITRTQDTLCAGETKHLFVNGAASYLWTADATLSGTTSSSPAVDPLQTTVYHVTGTDSYQCYTDTASVRITVGNPTRVSAGADTMILSGNTVQLHATSSLPDIRRWQWAGNATFSCLNCPAPAVKVIQDECLTCTATNVYGCVSTDTVCITTFCPGSEVFIPNAFSPDGDGINDVLFVQGRGIKTIKSFRIYSRWGELVFEKTNFSPGDRSAGWDGRIRGKLASPDVFVYVCEAICEKGIPALFKGNTAILR